MKELEPKQGFDKKVLFELAIIALMMAIACGGGFWFFARMYFMINR